MFVDTQHTGKIKWFNESKGYGFIIPDDGSEKDVFVHVSAVTKSGLTAAAMKDNSAITYNLEERNGKTAAVNLQLD